MHTCAFFANLHPTMSPISSALTSSADDSGIDDILQWLAGTPEILDDAHVDSLFEQLTLLRQTPCQHRSGFGCSTSSSPVSNP